MNSGLTEATGQDTLMREIAFAHVQKVFEACQVLTAEDLRQGFRFEGKRIPIFDPRRGIFKPKQMDHLLSIRTVFPKPGRRASYEDQKRQINDIYADSDVIEYSFMGSDPDAHNNQLLRSARKNQVPVIYFLGIEPSRYIPIRAFIVGWDPDALRARVSLTEDFASKKPATRTETRRYTMSQVKRRVHQARFRSAVVAAYGYRCAMSNLPEPQLLDAAHIIPDNDPHFGQPEVVNGLPLSKIHHEAFDRHLIGIDPDYCIHVSEQLLGKEDGPTLDSLKDLNGKRICLPGRAINYPDRERLELRFEEYRVSNGA